MQRAACALPFERTPHPSATKVPPITPPSPMSCAGASHPTICRRPPCPDGRIPCVRPVATQNENSLRSNSLADDEKRMNENMVWTDSQDYGADEILSLPFTISPPVQRAACALHFEGSVPTRINRNRSLNQIPHVIFNLSHLPEGCVPRFSKRIFTKFYF